MERTVQGTMFQGTNSLENEIVPGNERSRERMFQGTNSLGNEYSWYRLIRWAETGTVDEWLLPASGDRQRW